MLCPTKRLAVVGLAVVALVSTVATHVVASPEAMKALAIQPMREPTPAPDVTLSLLSGSRLGIKDLHGKALLVNFWATWCVPCQWEMPLMETLYQAYKDRGFVILAISLDQGDPARVRAFVADKKLTYPVALDPQMQAAQQFGVRGLPATLLVGPDGSIKGVTYGPKEWDGKAARELIASLLPARKGAVAR
ncbi:MAG: TlpA family protein disulfide reductase [Dehalococcoidia bacterium]|nr:TlpA family protein disulfide reductase [Dehalococcoidia bacterium]